MSDPPISGERQVQGEDRPLTGMVALRNRDFRLFFCGKAFAAIGQHMVTVAIGYQVYDRTGDPMDLAYIGLATFAPAFGFALFTGYVSDLFDRRLVLSYCYGVMMTAAVLLFIFTVSGESDVWPAFLIMSLMGTGRAFYQPASNALVPNLVPAVEFPNAVAWNTGANKVSQMLGPAIGGGLYLIGPEVVYATAAVACVFGILSTAMIRTRTRRTGKEPTSLRTLLAGLSYVYHKKVILGAITLDLFVVILGGVTALLPVFAKDILEVGPSGAGLLRSAAAFGAVLSAALLTQIAMTRGVGKILFVMVFIFGFATILFGLSQWFWLSMLAMAIIGSSDMVSVYIRSTLLQIATPDDMRGRVSAVNSVFTGASNEIGEFRAGTMAALIGTIPAVLFGGIGSIVVAALCWKLFPVLARVERMDRNM
ncbi:MAG: MFS transporter [Alphaproteobacteria bacterium]